MIKGIVAVPIQSVFHFQEETPACALRPHQHHYYIFTLTPQRLLNVDCIKEDNRDIFFFRLFASIH